MTMFRCTQCGEYIKDDKVESYGESNCHVVPAQISEYEWEPQPCGPLEYLEPGSVSTGIKKND